MSTRPWRNCPVWSGRSGNRPTCRTRSLPDSPHSCPFGGDPGWHWACRPTALPSWPTSASSLSSVMKANPIRRSTSTTSLLGVPTWCWPRVSRTHSASDSFPSSLRWDPPPSWTARICSGGDPVPPPPSRECRQCWPNCEPRSGVEVTLIDPQRSHQREQLVRLFVTEPGLGEHLIVERGGGQPDQPSSFGENLGQSAAPISRMREPGDQPLCLEPIDGIGDARRMHLQSGTDPAERQRSGAAEAQQHQQLVAGKGEVEGAERRVDPGQIDLMRPHDRGHRGHPRRSRLPSALSPLAACLFDGIEVEGFPGCCHRAPMPGPSVSAFTRPNGADDARPYQWGLRWLSGGRAVRRRPPGRLHHPLTFSEACSAELAGADPDYLIQERAAKGAATVGPMKSGRQVGGRVIGLGMTLLIMVTPACSGSIPTTSPTTSSPPLPVATAPTPIAWSACAGNAGFQCGSVSVPIDYFHPDGPTLRVAVSRILALDPAMRIGTLTEPH